MKRFTNLLRRAGERLDLPQPEKSRILLEIASDLDDSYRLYLGKGYSEGEAAKKAEEMFDVSDEALEQLVRIHESKFRKLLGRISEQAQTRWERVILVAIVLFIAGAAGRNLFSADLFRQASSFVWPLLVLSFGTLAVAVFQAYKLYIKKDHSVGRLQSGLPWLLAMAGLSLLTGFLGSLLEMYRSVVMSTEHVERSLVYLVDWALRCSAMMIVSLLVAIAAAVIWFVLMAKVRRIEVAEAAWLLE
jgi:hypothetical protein